jgi:subfamily B ATP-binding cassette protein MsbA
VPQEVFLFNDTFEANIRFGDLSQPFEMVLEAARRARAHEFIMETSRGYHTIIGSRESLLSGGQRQRIALARALLRHPAVLILDEAMSSVDAAEESHIQEALQDIEHVCTTIIITHRPESYPWVHRQITMEGK